MNFPNIKKYFVIESTCSDSSSVPFVMGHVYYLIPIWALATAWLYLLTRLAPALDEETADYLHFPHNLEDLQQLAKVLQIYKERNWLYVLVLFCSAYLYKQTFIIPGSVLLNLLGGALFGIYVGLPLVCVLTGIGSSLCYLWSLWLGKDLLEYYFPDRIKDFQEKVKRNEERLLYYMLFLRMFPMSPNWLINLLCPILGVPISTFFISIFIGLMPYNFLTVQTGEILSSLTSLNELITLETFLKLAAMACVALGPGLYLKNSGEDLQT
ncbi:transmembrane protein 41A-like [Periplaneta americana]|uniref:transmembrane protein 41A-like n=1 Tax=Periplaneta americana TaxID=6978 RepID=UPI0037E87FA2